MFEWGKGESGNGSGDPLGGAKGESGGRGRAPFKPQFKLTELFDKPPPQAPEAEMALLGAMILDPRVTGDVIMVVKSPSSFYQEAHGAIFQALVTLYDKHQAGDLVQLVDMLRDKEVLADVGGINYLEKLARETPGAAGATHWARIVAEKGKLRSLIETAGTIIHNAYTLGQGNEDNAGEIIDKAEQQIFEISRKHELFEPQSMAELVQIEFERLESMQGKGVSGVPSGYYELDKMTSGFQPGEMSIIAARPSMGKCLDANEEIVLADGRIATIEEVCREKRGLVPTLRDELRIEWRQPSDYIDDGKKPVFEVTTRLGRRVRTTLTHPFLTINGWKALGELSEGDVIGVPRRLPVFGDAAMRECEVTLLAFLIGDGGLTGTVPRFTNGNARVAEDFARAVREFGGLRLTRSDTRLRETPSWRVAAQRDDAADARAEFGSRLRVAIAGSGSTSRAIAQAVGVSSASVSNWTSGGTAPERRVFDRLCEVLHVRADDLAPGGYERIRRNRPSAMTRWLTTLGLMGRDSHGKFVPACVFTLPRGQVALFLNRLFATDGWATTLASGQAQLGYSSVSERLARQVQHLLLRFGVIASLRQRWVKYKDSRRASWQLDITDAKSIETFASEIGICGKEEALAGAVAAAGERNYQTNRDLIPIEVWRDIERRRGGRSWADLARAIGASTKLHVGKRGISRGRLAKIADALDDEHLRNLASSDVYWDRIVSIEPLGERQVYDLTMPGTHNFVASDVCVHNTALALNLAEQVALGGLEDPNSGKRVDTPVGFFSLEMSKSAIAQRLLSSRSGVGLQDMRAAGTLDRDGHDRMLRKILGACEELHDSPIYIDDMPGLTVMGLRARARRMVQQYGVKMIFIDYLQLMTAPAFAKESRQVEVSAISRGIKALARELNMPIVCLSQLNRGPESRSDNKPRMSDLRESGAIEQDADVIMLLHREEYYHVGDPSWAADPDNTDKLGVAELIIAKQRNGPTGVVELKWDAETTRFKNLSRSVRGGYAQDDSWPGQDAGTGGGTRYPSSRGGSGGGGGGGGGNGGGGGPSRGHAHGSSSTIEPKPGAGVGGGSGYGGGGGVGGGLPVGGFGGGYADDVPFDVDDPVPPPAPTGQPSPGGGRSFFTPKPKSGPEQNFRDGGGPDADNEPEPEPDVSDDDLPI